MLITDGISYGFVYILMGMKKKEKTMFCLLSNRMLSLPTLHSFWLLFLKQLSEAVDPVSDSDVECIDICNGLTRRAKR